VNQVNELNDSVKSLELVWNSAQNVLTKQKNEIEELSKQVAFWKNEYEECAQQSMKALQELYDLKNIK
jgi:predicted  nucleic acid-binding Zn-ribbon protein